MEDVPALIVLKDKTPVAIGTSQFVYEHPDDPKLLVKVLKREKLQKSYDRKIGGRIGFKRRHGLYVTWMREIEHYFSVTIRLGYRPSFFQEYRGVVDTDLGLGMVVGKETDRSGNLAPTLQTLVRTGRFTPQIRQEFQDLLDQINKLRISTTDTRSNETVFEVSYAAQIAPWWTVQPDFQYITHPGGNVEDPANPGTPVRDAAVIGVRSVLKF